MNDFSKSKIIESQIPCLIEYGSDPEKDEIVLRGKNLTIGLRSLRLDQHVYA